MWGKCRTVSPCAAGMRQAGWREQQDGQSVHSERTEQLRRHDLRQPVQVARQESTPAIDIAGQGRAFATFTRSSVEQSRPECVERRLCQGGEMGLEEVGAVLILVQL